MGLSVGETVGLSVGDSVGDVVGLSVGESVGLCKCSKMKCVGDSAAR